MKKLIYIMLIMPILLIIFSSLASAHCPLCTAAAGTGVGIARAYGVDDSIVGLLLGGFIASSGLWASNWLKKKKINFHLQAFILVVASFLLLAIPFYASGLITNFSMVMSMPEHHSMLGLGIYGIDKLLFGMITGTILISIVFSFSDKIKEKKGRRLFPFQGMVFMLISLALFSFIFWFIT